MARPTSMHAENLVLDAGGKRQPVEERIEAGPGPDAVRIAQPLDALYSESEQSVDVCRLLTEQADLLSPLKE